LRWPESPGWPSYNVPGSETPKANFPPSFAGSPEVVWGGGGEGGNAANSYDSGGGVGNFLSRAFK
jgi:hypothetical protein